MSEPRTEAGREAMHAVDMIGEAFNIDIGYKDWRNRILAIEREAAAPETLDVERLAHELEAEFLLNIDPTSLTPRWWQDRARDILTRLSRKEPSE